MASGKDSRSYLIVTFSSLGGFLFGYQTGVISGLLIMRDFQNMTNITDDKDNMSDVLGIRVGAIVGILLFGCFLGSLIGGQTSDRFSRKYSISLFSFIYTFSVLLQTLRVDLSMVLVARLIAGNSERNERVYCKGFSRDCHWSAFNDRSCLSFGNSSNETSWTIDYITTIGHHYWHRIQLLD